MSLPYESTRNLSLLILLGHQCQSYEPMLITLPVMGTEKLSNGPRHPQPDHAPL